MRLFSTILTCLLLSPATVTAQKLTPPQLIATSPSLLASQCFGCHGPEGSSQGPATPSIAGLDKGYIVNAMLAYKYGDNKRRAEKAAERAGLSEFDFFFLPRPSTIMNRIARGYTDQQLAIISDYFSRRPYVLHKQKTDRRLRSRGKRLHKKYCEKCHEDGGRTSDSGSGVLAGQWMPFLRQTLADYQSGDRHMTEKMAKKIKKIRGNDMEALIHYYGSQR